MAPPRLPPPRTTSCTPSCRALAPPAVMQAAAAGVAGDLASFVRGDMLDAPLGEGVRVVVLTSQCWDKSLHDGAARRLAEGLTSGALVVDYGRRLAEEEAFGEPIATLTLPVSWNNRQTFCVFKRR